MTRLQSIRLLGVMLALASGLAVRAAQTNAPAASSNAPAAPKDYRAMLQQVRLKQQERNGLEELQKAISDFQLRMGRLPATLGELVERGLLPDMPRPPPYTRFVYDRITGNVRLASATVSTTVRTNLPGSANLVLPH
jgi:hypothetical protein